MKAKTLLIALLFLTSILAGCAGNDSDTSKDDEILSLESEIINITAEKDEALENNLILQSTLDSSDIALEVANSEIDSLTLNLTLLKVIGWSNVITWVFPFVGFLTTGFIFGVAGKASIGKKYKKYI